MLCSITITFTANRCWEDNVSKKGLHIVPLYFFQINTCTLALPCFTFQSPNSATKEKNVCKQEIRYLPLPIFTVLFFKGSIILMSYHGYVDSEILLRPPHIDSNQHQNEGAKGETMLSFHFFKSFLWLQIDISRKVGPSLVSSLLHA
jgi:hypothetical protein